MNDESAVNEFKRNLELNKNFISLEFKLSAYKIVELIDRYKYQINYLDQKLILKNNKMCASCGEIKPVDEFPKKGGRYKNGSLKIRSRCKTCYYKVKPKTDKKHRKSYNKKQSDNLGDSYIKKLIYKTGVKYSEITPEMIETKRLNILIKRELKK